MTADVVTRVAPLGLRFWDEVNRDLVRDGLRITAWPARVPSRTRVATVNRSGVWALSSLDGMRAFEQGLGDAGYWASVDAGTDPVLGARRAFVVRVEDTSSRFLPVLLHVELPVRGIYAWSVAGMSNAGALGAGAPPGVIPLPVAPQRAVRDLAVVRAELWPVGASAPAAHALLEVSSEGRLLGRGVSDARGQVVVTFPYPDTLALPGGSPLASPIADGHPSSWRWDLDVAVRYEPAAVGPTIDGIPELGRVFAQAPAIPLQRTSPEAPLGSVRLRHSEELVLRTDDSHEGRLSIHPMG